MRRMWPIQITASVRSRLRQKLHAHHPAGNLPFSRCSQGPRSRSDCTATAGGLFSGSLRGLLAVAGISVPPFSARCASPTMVSMSGGCDVTVGEESWCLFLDCGAGATFDAAAVNRPQYGGCGFGPRSSTGQLSEPEYPLAAGSAHIELPCASRLASCCCGECRVLSAFFTRRRAPQPRP